MLQDKSEGQEATWEFLDRRIDNVMTVGKAINQNKVVGDAISTGLQSIFTIVKPQKFDDSEMLKKQQDLAKEEQKSETKSSESS